MKVVCLCLLLQVTGIVLAQYPSAQFSFPDNPYNVCIGGIAEVQNNSTNATSYLWDFCPETFTEPPVVSAQIPISGLVNGWAYKVVRSNGNWFGFLASRNTNKLYRLEFGPDPSSNPVVVDLGNPGGLLVSPQGMELVNHNGNWFLFVGKGETTVGQVTRFDFGNDLTSTPVPFGLGTFGINGRIRDLKVVKQGADLILLMINDTGNAIVRVNYGNSFANPIAPSNIFPTGVLQGANLPIGFSVVKTNGNWIVHTVSFINSGIQQYNFGADILGVPTLEGNFNFTSVVRPYYIKVIREGKDYFAFVGNESLKMAIINFNDLSGVNTPQELPNSNLSSLVNFDVIKFESENIIQGAVRGTANFIQLSFQNNNCAVSKQWEEAEVPSNLYWNQPGAATIELEVRGDNYLLDNTSKDLLVTTDLAPIMNIQKDNSCLSSFITYSTASSEPLISWNWDFGDTQSSTVPNPIHQYAVAGDYEVSLWATASNGCKNLAGKTVTIYNEPVADFDLPSASPICTNQDYLFTNTSTFDPGSNPSWQWEVNGTPTSTTQDLTFEIPTATMQDIKLISSIPGCSSEVTKTINTVEEGPMVDFSFANDCEDKPIAFTNATVGTVTGYAWDFGDGNNTTQTSPSHAFADFGNYEVKLVASNAAGCNNSATKPIQVYSKPQPDFSLDLPPFSCSGSPSQFNDLTPGPADSNLSGWSWTFGDAQNGTSSDRDPQYVYAEAGQYDVGLEVSTNYGCTASVQKTVTISASPDPGFTYGAACINEATLFSPTATTGVGAWQWKIGNDTYNQQNPTHVFVTASGHNAQLTATGLNGCMATSSQTIIVPEASNVDFSVEKSCAGQNTLFADLTTGPDPVVSRAWQFGALGAAAGASPSFAFSSPGNYPTTLTVTNESGCSYSISKNVNITAPPVATFTATPQAGAPPLSVLLMNTTLGSVSQLWTVEGAQHPTSTEVAPSFTFSDLGEYVVDLAIEDGSGCTAVASKTVSIVIPTFDMVITNLVLVPAQSGGSNLLLTMANHGNVPVNNLRAVVDVSGEAVLSEAITATIQPNEEYSQILSVGTIHSRAPYLCVELVPEGGLPMGNNKKCISQEAATAVLPPYPNPVADDLSLEWVSSQAGDAEINIFGPAGRKVYAKTFATNIGLTKATIPVALFGPGIYHLLFVTGSTRKSFSFAVQK